MQKDYIKQIPNNLDLGEWGLVEDALKYYFENKSNSSDETIRWTVVYGKVLKTVQIAIKAFSDRNNTQ